MIFGIACCGERTASVEGAKHDLWVYEYLQKGLSKDGGNDFVPFSEKFTEDGRKIIHRETSEFGRKLTQAMLVLTYEICTSSKTILTLTKPHDLAMRSCGLYSQEKGQITQKVFQYRMCLICQYRMRLICFITVISAQQKRIGSVMSTTNFIVQRYMFVNHFLLRD